MPKPAKKPWTFLVYMAGDNDASYKGSGEAVTQSLCDLGESARLAAAVKALATSLTTATGRFCRSGRDPRRARQGPNLRSSR